MSATIYPKFENMLPNSEDIQLIVDSYKEEDRKRLTVDGIWQPGIVNEPDNYLTSGTITNTVKILPFIGYTKNGNRIEIDQIQNNLSPQDDGTITSISGYDSTRQTNIPEWRFHTKDFTNFSGVTSNEANILLETLPPQAIIHSTKLTNTLFTGVSNLYVSIGTLAEPEKYSPKRLISTQPTSTNIETSSSLYSESTEDSVGIYAFFSCTSGETLQSLVQGSATFGLCITYSSESDFDPEDVGGGFELGNKTGYWRPSTSYYIVARYTTIESDERSINIVDTANNIDITTPAFYSRVTDNFTLYALRMSGTATDTLTNDDIKLGKVIVDASNNITIYTNGYDSVAKNYYTDYFKLPNYRVEDSSINYVDRITNCIFGTEDDVLTYTLNDPTNMVITSSANITLLIPNGKKDTRTLNNNIYTTTSSLTTTIVGSGTKYILIKDGELVNVDIVRVVESDTQPTIASIRYWYDSKNNQWYYRSSDGGVFSATSVCKLGKVASTESNGIASVTTYPVMQLVTKQELNDVIVTQSSTSNEVSNKMDRIFQQVSTVSIASNIATVLLSTLYSFYQITPDATTSIVIDSSNISITLDNMCTFELGIDLTAGVQTINWPSNISWLNNNQPVLASEKYYYFSLRSRDYGVTWVANLQGTSD